MSPEAKLNIMKHFKFSLKLLIALIGLYTTTACSDKNDGPDIPDINYNKLKIGRMDLSGAVSVGLKNEDNSRAINGEYLSAGMYKIDTDGKIYAVAVYFTTDTLGNRLDHEERLRIVPKNLENISKDYLLVIDCSYYDREGDKVSDKWEFNEETEEGRWIKQDVPYKHLLVRKSDGKIWCVDNIKDNIVKYSRLNGQFIESNRGDLYFVNADSDAAFKFNLSSDEASFEQITTGDGTIYDGDYFVTDNGIIGQANNESIYFGWPHSGFTNINGVRDIMDADLKEEIPIEGLELGKYKEFKWSKYTKRCQTFVFENNIYILALQSYNLFCKNKYNNWDFKTYDASERETIEKIVFENEALRPVIYKITPGNNPGEYSFTNLTNLEVNKDFETVQVDYYSRIYTFGYKGSYHFISDDKIYLLLRESYANLTSYYSWLTRYNFKDNKWQVIKKLEFDLNYYNIEYQDKLWFFDKKNNKINPGIYWLDLNAEDSGFIKFNTLPDFVKYKEYENGVITYSGVDPSTSNTVNIYIDITTGEAVNEVNTPEMIFNTLIPLN